MLFGIAEGPGRVLLGLLFGRFFSRFGGLFLECQNLLHGLLGVFRLLDEAFEAPRGLLRRRGGRLQVFFFGFLFGLFEGAVALAEFDREELVGARLFKLAFGVFGCLEALVVSCPLLVGFAFATTRKVYETARDQSRKHACFGDVANSR